MNIILTKKEEQLLIKMSKKFSTFEKKGQCRDIQICDVSSSGGKCSSNCSLYGTDLCHLLAVLENQTAISRRLLEISKCPE